MDIARPEPISLPINITYLTISPHFILAKYDRRSIEKAFERFEDWSSLAIPTSLYANIAKFKSNSFQIQSSEANGKRISALIFLPK